MKDEKQEVREHDPRCLKMGDAWTCVVGCPAFRMGAVPKREPFSPPTLRKLTREEAKAKLTRSNAIDVRDAAAGER